MLVTQSKNRMRHLPSPFQVQLVALDFADATAIGTINDNDTTPTLSATAPATVDEDAGTLTITTTLTNITEEVVTMTYSTTNGSASGTGADADFVAQTNQTHMIPASTLSNTFTIPIMDDLVYEGDENFTITISSVNNAIIAGNATQIVLNNITITDNESPVEISFEEMNPTVGEGRWHFYVKSHLKQCFNSEYFSLLFNGRWKCN